MVLGLIWALAGVGGGGNKNYPNTHNWGRGWFDSSYIWHGMLVVAGIDYDKIFFDLEKITPSDRNKTTIYFA